MADTRLTMRFIRCLPHTRWDQATRTQLWVRCGIELLLHARVSQYLSIVVVARRVVSLYQVWWNARDRSEYDIVTTPRTQRVQPFIEASFNIKQQVLVSDAMQIQVDLGAKEKGLFVGFNGGFELPESGVLELLTNFNVRLLRQGVRRVVRTR